MNLGDNTYVFHKLSYVTYFYLLLSILSLSKVSINLSSIPISGLFYILVFSILELDKATSILCIICSPVYLSVVPLYSYLSFLFQYDYK